MTIKSLLSRQPTAAHQPHLPRGNTAPALNPQVPPFTSLPTSTSTSLYVDSSRAVLLQTAVTEAYNPTNPLSTMRLRTTILFNRQSKNALGQLPPLEELEVIQGTTMMSSVLVSLQSLVNERNSIYLSCRTSVNHYWLNLLIQECIATWHHSTWQTLIKVTIPLKLTC